MKTWLKAYIMPTLVENGEVEEEDAQEARGLSKD